MNKTPYGVVSKDDLLNLLPDGNNNVTLGESRKLLIDGFRKGTRCPCCGRYTRLYKRALNITMVKSLAWLASAGGWEEKQWVDTQRQAPRWVLKTKQLSTTAKWRLIERRKNIDPAKKHSGIWRVTPLGLLFLRGELPAPTHYYELFNNVVGFHDHFVYVSDILKGYHYQRHMNGLVNLEDWGRKSGPICGIREV